MCLGNTSPTKDNNKNFSREGHFISWNGRGISNKKEELEILAKNLMPIAFLVQETKLKENHNFCLKNYSFLHKAQIINEGENSKGGVGIFIRKNTPYVPVNINTNFQATAAQISCHKKITFCSIYIPPEQDFTKII